jgi:hypothetical protein
MSFVVSSKSWLPLDPDAGLIFRPISNGQVKIWNYETQTDLKTFEVTDVPVRCVRYIARKNWVCNGTCDVGFALTSVPLVCVRIRRLPTPSLQHLYRRAGYLFRSSPRLYPMHDCSPDIELGVDR